MARYACENRPCRWKGTHEEVARDEHPIHVGIWRPKCPACGSHNLSAHFSSKEHHLIPPDLAPVPTENGLLEADR
jgi:hypothetical protein